MTGPAVTVRVLVADDHGAVRAGIRSMLAGAEDIEVVGDAGDGAAAVRQTRALRPDVVLMDIRMPGTDGIAATEAIVAAGAAQVVVLTAVDVDEHVMAALRAGASAFLLKTVDAAGLRDAIRRVAAGEGVLAPEVTRALIGRLAASPGPAADGPASGAEHLTEREREVLDGLGRGLSNTDLAVELRIGEATVKTHVSRVLAKLGCRSRLQAALLARTMPL